MKKRILSLLLALLLVLGLMPGAMAAENEPEAADALVSAAEVPEETPAETREAAADAPEGDGTAANPYQLTDAEALFWFAAAVNGGQAELCADLTQDVDLKNADWTPIGSLSNRFQGTFDGNGHTVKGLKVSDQEYAGLFGYAENAVIRNVVVRGSVLGSKYAAGVAGYIRGQTQILNCGNEAAVTSTGKWAGGVAGYAGEYGAKNQISGCYNTAAVTSQGAGGYAGGILAQDYGDAAIEACYNAGTVSAVKYAGGIRGNLGASTGTILYCYNIASVTGEKAGPITSSTYYGSACYALRDGKIFCDTDEEKPELTKPELLDALNEGKILWKQDKLVNGGYPLLSWQKISAPQGELVLAQDVEFAHEPIETDEGDMLLPTSELSWRAVENASGYVLALWRYGYGWRALSEEEKKAYTAPEAGTSYTDLLAAVDQDAIIAEFTPEQRQVLLKLQQELEQKDAARLAALQERGYAAPDEYEAADAAYQAALAEYRAAYEVCSRYIIEQAVACGYPLGWQEREISLAEAVTLGNVTSYDCGKELLELGDGVYYATVSAMDEAGGYSLPDAGYVEESVAGWQEPYTRMQAVTNLHWEGTTACWDAKPSFTAGQVYRIDLYTVEDGTYTFFKTFEIEGNFSKASFRGVFAARRSYAFTVTALTDEELMIRCGLTQSLPSRYSDVYTPDASSQEKEPIVITSAEQWLEIANTEDVPSDPDDANSPSMQELVWSRNYCLESDIDFSTLSPADQQRTKSIGTKTYMFQGEFDGNGHKITGLTLSGSDSGLFWYAGELSYIHDVQIVKPNVNFTDNASVLVHNNYGILENCAVIDCNINADLGGVIGGMASRNYGIIRACYVQGGTLNAYTTSSTGHAGFVGANEAGGIIERCWTSMDVNTMSDYAGGFVGLGYDGIIRDCFALGNVSARSYSGGFVGRSVYANNLYENCYAAGMVRCAQGEGHGFIGGNKPGSDFQYDQSDGIKNCYYNQQSEQAPTNFGAIGMSLEQMQSDSFCQSLGTRWTRDSETNDALPYLKDVAAPKTAGMDTISVTIELVAYNKEAYCFERFGEPIQVSLPSNGNTLVMNVMDAACEKGLLSYAYEVTNQGRYVSVINGRELLAPDGWMFMINNQLSAYGISLATAADGDVITWFEGTTQNNYQPPDMEELDQGASRWKEIRTADALVALAQTDDPELLAGNYRLEADIDLKGIDFPGIGSQSAPFTGMFDGNGRTISNLTICKPEEDDVGLFRVLYGGTVKNLTLKNANVTGKGKVGAVVGQAKVSLDAQSMAGSVAGLIGNVYASGAVSGTEKTGGIVGLNGGAYDSKTDFSASNAIDGCTFYGTVTGETITGGIAGQNDGIVTSSAAGGSVEAGQTGKMAGGAVGQNEGKIYYSVSDVAVHAQSYVGGFVGSGSGSVKQCYSLGDVSGADYVGGFAGAISNVETAISAGKVSVDGTQQQGYVGGFAGKLGGTIVGASGSITVRNVYGYCAQKDGGMLPAAGITDTMPSDGLTSALTQMRLETPAAVKSQLKTIFDVDFTRYDEELEREKDAAKALEKKIKKLPADTKLKLANRDLVLEVKAAYDALTADAKLFVSEDALNRLNACLARLAELERENAAEIAKADEFKNCMPLVPAQGAQVTSADEQAIRAARAAYDQITDKDLLKTLKTLYKQLTAAEKALTKNRAAAQKVQTQIDALPEKLADLTLSLRKTVDKAQKAYEKLTDGQKTFLTSGSQEKLSACVRRMTILEGNETLIKAAEKAVKSVPAAEKIRASDSAKLKRAADAIDAVRQQEALLKQEEGLEDLTLTVGDEQRYLDAQAAYTRYEAEADAYREAHLANLPASQDVALSDAEKITNARTAYKSLSKNVQSFIDKAELSNLSACEKQLKKVQSQDKKDRSAAAKVETQIYKLPDVKAGQAVTERNRKAITAARTAYEKLNQKQYVSEAALSYLEACEAALAAL